jgi:hypothetical protein
MRRVTSYQADRDAFLIRMGQEGLPAHVATARLRAATTLQRDAELLCSSEYACNLDVTLCFKQALAGLRQADAGHDAILAGLDAAWSGTKDLRTQVAELQETVETLQRLVMEQGRMLAEQGRLLQAQSLLIADLQEQLRRA